MSTAQHQLEVPKARTTAHFGYVVAIVVNIAMLVIANNILAWGWLPFLTADFAEVLPLIDMSLLATIVVNATYLAHDPPWFKSVCQIAAARATVSALAAAFSA